MPCGGLFDSGASPAARVVRHTTSDRLVADTEQNRGALAAAPGAFAGLTASARAILAALRIGRDPATGGIVIL